jgi:hypothetical protein
MTVVVPSANPDGVTVLIMGIGFQIVTVAEPGGADGKTSEVAVIVTESGVGTIAGAVYRPVPVIVPTTSLPPGTPFTEKFMV